MMNKHYIVFFLLMLFGFRGFSQRENKVDPDKDLRMSVLPYYNFGKGLGLTSPDSIFQLNIRFRMQNRATYFDEEGIEGKINAEVRRLRLRFDGYVGNPKFMYAIQLSFSPGDTGGTIEDGENMQIIRDAVIFYQPTDSWTFSFGQTKLPGNRQRMNSSGALQFTDRSINNSKFSIDRDFGIQAHNLNEFKDRFSYNFKTAISTGEGRNETGNSDTGLAYTGKIELFPFGPFKNNGSLFEGDIIREEKPKLMVSGAYSYNNKATKSQGQLGDKLFEKRNMSSLFFDAMVKYNGWTFMTAYMNRVADNPLTVNPQDNSDISFVYVGSGMDYQLSYLFPNNFELLGRYSYQKMHKDVETFVPNQNQYSFGITKYIWEHAFKMQAEVTFDELNYINDDTKNNWYIRFQVEIGI
ncbi:MAG TPA: porin [Flavobacterium sp.]|nr:porin [Flavobacterium sp.]